MKKKKYLIGLALAALSLTTLVACGDDAKPATSEDDNSGNGPIVAPTPAEDDTITINVANKEYDSNPATISATAKSGKTVKLEYKLEREDDSEYSTTAPTTPGRYVVKASTEETSDYHAETTTAEFKISTDMLPDEYKQYENTTSYIKVTTEKEFLDALYATQNVYTNNVTGIKENDGYVVRNNVRKNESNWVNAITKGLYLKDGDNYVQIDPNTPWDPDDTNYTASMTYYEDSPYTTLNYTQTVNTRSEVKVIEIAADLDLGYNKIKDLGANSSTYENWDKSKRLEGKTDVYCDPDIQAAGISKIKVNKANDLLIYSKNGAKLTHCGFAVSASKDITFKNLDMDEIWMWEDSTSATPTIKVGDYDAFGWAYFKVSFSEGITIDHCTFGKSFDGQIDYSNPYYQSMGTISNAPLEGTGSNSLIVSNCDFRAGSSDEAGYIYKMMNTIEKEYQVYAANTAGYTYSNKSCRYYFTLRDKGLSFDDIMHGIVLPQKKAFLWGDSGDSYKYNKYLQAALVNCTIRNIEDRLPKVRGGIAYVYNVLVDNTEYYSYVSKIKSVQGAVQSANSKYKLGAVSQGIIAGLDASVYLESVEYKGISEYLKNNDSSNDNYPTVNGGYMIKNSILGDAKGSSTDATNPFVGLQKNSITTDAFSFKVNGEKVDLTEPPAQFKFEAYDLLTNGSLTKYFKTHSTGAI
ncbi:MAG: hypothetical protein IJP63_05880 [Acholeplasmatales bacterium]|nr:hypothetical protein [Acholeplasmatales bacterium]